MSLSYTDQQLPAYLDETLSSDMMSLIEQDLRAGGALRERLVQIAGLREAGVHSLGEIWRRNRLSCPSREQLGSFILGILPPDTEQYLRFHLEQVGCRLCRANFEDLESQRIEQQQATQTRRHKYFQTSAGYLTKHKSD